MQSYIRFLTFYCISYFERMAIVILLLFLIVTARSLRFEQALKETTKADRCTQQQIKTNQMNKIYGLTLLLAMSLMACSNDDAISNEMMNGVPCSDAVVDLGTVLLHPEAVEFIPYTGEEDIYFKNESGAEVKFEPLYGPISHNFNEGDFELTCDDGSINNYVLSREQYSVSHKCEALNLQYYLNVYPNNSREHEAFIDLFSLVFHEPPTDYVIDTAINLNIITSYRGLEDLLSAEFIYYNYYELDSEIQLLGKTFYEVYKVIRPASNLLTELYYNKAFGIVGFKDLDLELWVFDRME